jgi:hypothetical protein
VRIATVLHKIRKHICSLFSGAYMRKMTGLEPNAHLQLQGMCDRRNRMICCGLFLNYLKKGNATVHRSRGFTISCRNFDALKCWAPDSSQVVLYLMMTGRFRLIIIIWSGRFRPKTLQGYGVKYSRVHIFSLRTLVVASSYKLRR